MNVLEIIFDRTLSVLLMTFTYLIPLLSSIRAVHHKDLQAYQQWLTYFLLIFLFHPICAILRIHKLFRLLIVLYLSLPKFQGALFVYQEVIHVLLERYAVERKVDEHLDKFKTSIRARLWNIAKDIGWSALTQVGEVVSFVKDTVGHKEDLDEDGHDATSKRNILKKEDDLFVNSTIKRNPSHSVLESWSSFCSQEGSDQTNCNLNDIPFHERESYVQDFLAMLREGLYVFAAQYSAPTIDDKEKREEASKIFRLRVFFYQDSFKNDNVSSSKESADISNDHAKCKSSTRFFVFQSVEQIHSHEANHQDDVEVISMDDIHDIQRTSANGIEFLCTVANTLEESVSTSSSTGETANDANITTTIICCYYWWYYYHPPK
jgi:TB2/DP1, HVA22 family.